MARTVAGTRISNFTSLSFNGTSHFVSSNIWTTGTTNYSMGGWFKSSDYTQTRQVIMSNGDGTGGTGRGQALVLSGNDTTDGSMYVLNHVIAWISLGFKIQSNTWNHIILTRDGSGNSKFYLNGVLKVSAAQTFNTPNGASSYIGKDNGGGFFKGLLDDMRFYSAELTAAQVKEIYMQGTVTATPTNWYKFDEGTGTTAIDSGSSAKNGTISGATYSSTLPFGGRSTAGARTLAGTRTAA